MENEESAPSKKSNNTVIFFVIVLLLIIAGGYYYVVHQNASVKPASSQTATVSPTSTATPSMHASDSGQMPPMDMQKATPAPLTVQQKKQLDAGTSTSTTEKTFNLTGGNFYFTPNKLTVNKGDKVTIIFTSNGGIHDFVIDEFNAKTDIVNTGKSATVSFVADKTGTFQFYCSVGQHRQLGMVGTLTVQ